MKTAEVYSMRAQTAHGVVWKWRSDDRAKRSFLAFATYDDCVADARKNGFSVGPLRDSTH
jgi:hypothetical protein